MPTNNSGDDNNPINNDREKLTVASDARNIPRRRKEKDLSNSLCCRVGAAKL